MLLDTLPATRLDAKQQDVGPDHAQAPTPSGSHPGPNWFVVASYSQAERRAATNLRHQGYPVYLPLMTVSRRDRVVWSMFHRVEVPLFPCYLFVQFDAARDPWRPISHTPGVFRLLTNASNSIPEPVSHAVMAALQATEDARRTITPPGAAWAPGAPCSLAGGPLSGADAVILSVRRNVARVALVVLGGLRKVTVPVEQLRART